MLRQKVTECIEPSLVSAGTIIRHLHLESSGPCFNNKAWCWQRGPGGRLRASQSDSLSEELLGKLPHLLLFLDSLLESTLRKAKI